MSLIGNVASVVAKASSSLIGTNTGDRLVPAAAPTLIIFVVGGITAAEISAVRSRVQLIHAAHDAATVASSTATAAKSSGSRNNPYAGGESGSGDSDGAYCGDAAGPAGASRAPPPPPLPQVVLGGSCLTNPEALFSQALLG